MEEFTAQNPAPGGPGIEPRWTSGTKDAVGTAYSTSSQVWYTLALGVFNELYYPTIDRPQVRDLQYLITDGETFFHDERRDTQSTIEMLDDQALGFRVTNEDPEGRYRIVKEIIGDPHQPCMLVHTKFEADPEWQDRLRLYALLAPRCDGTGWGNDGAVMHLDAQQVLVAHNGASWLALRGTVPFRRCSCGYVGENDGWTDLHDNFQMDWEYDGVEDGNIALTGEIDLAQGTEFTLGLAFGSNLHRAATTLFQSLSFPFDEHKERFINQWHRADSDLLPLHEQSHDGGALFHRSHDLLLAHEDKTYQGATIASLSIPWGDAKSDEAGLGGYHLVWTRDLVQSLTGLLAAGNASTPLRGLIYIAMSQNEDGGFHQNFWLDGTPFWTGIQLDEVAFPILLAWRLDQAGALQEFDPYPMVRRAAGYLIRQGPDTPQERWEEASGYSPSTLAVCIAALTCAAEFARQRGDDKSADFIQDYADFLNCHVEEWTVTTEGALHPEISRHYIRIHPVDPDDVRPNENPDQGTLAIANRPPDARVEFPAKDVVDAGFLELVRYGVRPAGDELIEDSLRVVDRVLKMETPNGPAWHRYNHDGYGEHENGDDYVTWGVGRAWPLLTGERGHYELAAGRDPYPYVEAMEHFAHGAGLLSEQVWDEEDIPEKHLIFGEPTGAATPLMWAHSEYIRLLRSIRDGEPFDRIPAVVDRYTGGEDGQTSCRALEVWKPNRQISQWQTNRGLRIQAPGRFTLRWTKDEWATEEDIAATETVFNISYVDIPVDDAQSAPVRFTFHWTDEERWEGQNYTIHPVQA